MAPAYQSFYLVIGDVLQKLERSQEAATAYKKTLTMTPHILRPRGIGRWSRKIVGWEIHNRETTSLASQCFERMVARNGTRPVYLYVDNGNPMQEHAQQWFADFVHWYIT
ncbi:DDE-type integrase/transposase/recombinase [Gracilinema caldarium]|uniref:Integrase catalytic region n=1 Tax=Gracilinema caldarium (strain ATCC 51460 / DSM 7334 / H1) TaxID=744872 RepID=F8F4A2_GRAC1|nr:DDE-type integrase/transposase/recombinase [Gracilinema caldarium]AEJ20549.1 Integrase catalytic region [Gracilinema caldarium DSM 7334]